METAIINRKDSAISQSAEIQMLWFSMLISEKIYLTSETSLFFSKDLVSKTDIRGNLRYFRMYLPLIAPTIKPEEYDEVVEAYFIRKKLKHKSKGTLIIDMKAERFFKWLEGQYFKLIKTYQEVKDIKVLSDINDLAGGHIIIARFPHEDISEFDSVDSLTGAGLGIIGCSGIIPVLDISARDTKVYKNNFSFNSFDGKLIISPAPLLSVPAPMGLKVEQLKIVRREFIAAFEPVFGILPDMIKRKESFDYSDAENISRDFNEIVDMLLSSAGGFQEVIDNQVYMSYLRNQCRDLPEYKLHLGFCSNENLVRLYWEMKVISDNIYLDIRHRMKGVIKMNAWMPVLVADRG